MLTIATCGITVAGAIESSDVLLATTAIAGPLIALSMSAAGMTLATAMIPAIGMIAIDAHTVVGSATVITVGDDSERACGPAFIR